MRPLKAARAAFAKATGMELGKAALTAFGSQTYKSGSIFNCHLGFTNC